MTGLIHKIADKVTGRDHDEHSNSQHQSHSSQQTPSYTSGSSYPDQPSPARYGGPQPPSGGYQSGSHFSGNGMPSHQPSSLSSSNYSQQPVRDGRHGTGEAQDYYDPRAAQSSHGRYSGRQGGGSYGQSSGGGYSGPSSGGHSGSASSGSGHSSSVGYGSSTHGGGGYSSGYGGSGGYGGRY